MSDNTEKMLKQVEFYFSDANLRRDKFMQSKISEDADGMVSLEVLLSFKRMTTLTNSEEELATALEKSEVLKLSEDKKKVGRVSPLPEVSREEAQGMDFTWDLSDFPSVIS